MDASGGKRLSSRLCKSALAEKLIRFPLLRLLVLEFWFRLAFLGFVLLLVFLALFLPRIWRVSPRGFRPVIKVSGLDVMQAWSLRRTARQAMAAGQLDLAMEAWRVAVANNPANTRLVREFLGDVLKSNEAKPYLPLAATHCSWLLRLTGTNQAEVELVARVYHKFRLEDLLLSLLRPMENRLSAPLEAIYLMALFNQNQVESFARRWERADASLAGNPELQLYHAAWQAGWGPLSTTAAGRQRLAAAQENPAQRVLAHRLQLAVNAHLREPERYEQALKKLVEWREDIPADHVNYWRLLAQVGQKNRAAQLAQDYRQPPASAAETIQLAEVSAQLGLREQALQVLQRYAPPFGYAEGIWVFYSQLLMEDQKWDAVADLALQIRQETQVRDTLAGYSYCLEGRAALAQQRRHRAETAFNKATEFPFENIPLGLWTASQLRQWGFPNHARDLLAKLPEAAELDPEYWATALAAAYETKQVDPMLQAAAKAYYLKPDDWMTMNNYAAALLVARQQPQEAIKLTMQLLTSLPASAPPKIAMAFKINHSLALLLNQRAAEAEAILKTIPENSLMPMEANAYYLAWFELSCHRQQWEQARQMSQRLDPNFLFPNQRLWLDKMRKQMPPTSSKERGCLPPRLPHSA
jgi:hypothetical protein